MFIIGGSWTHGTHEFPTNVFGFHPGPNDAAVLGIENEEGAVKDLTIPGSIISRDTGDGHQHHDRGLHRYGAARCCRDRFQNLSVPFGPVTIPALAVVATVYAILDKDTTFGSNATELDLTATFS